MRRGDAVYVVVQLKYDPYNPCSVTVRRLSVFNSEAAAIKWANQECRGERTIIKAAVQ